jgi:NAD(P)-dependent dehydrogenase (short-subunit alcohol dehydrogenase family)
MPIGSQLADCLIQVEADAPAHAHHHRFAIQGGEAIFAHCDVTKQEDLDRAVKTAVDSFGKVDILINNVGGSRPGGNLTASRKDWFGGFNLNFFSALELCRIVVPLMSVQQSGCVINIASVYGREWGGPMTYNAAKAAIISGH